MNTTVLMAARGEASRVQAGFRQAEAFVHSMEDRFSRFQNESELCSLNRSSGEWFLVSQDLYDVVRLAHRAYFDTGGLFNPAILAALEYAGYDRSMEGAAPFHPTRQDADTSGLVIPDFGAARFDPMRKAILLPPGLRIDLGGIAKGWIAEQAARLLRQYADGCVVDAGGDLFAIGSPLEGEFWVVLLENPFNPAEDITTIRIPSGAVATSAVTRRRWKQAGIERHHIIDPRTGLPAEAFWASVTVIADHTAEAEVLAKALLIAGPTGAPALISRHPQAVYIAVDMHGQIWGSPNSHEVLDAKVLSVS